MDDLRLYIMAAISFAIFLVVTCLVYLFFKVLKNKLIRNKIIKLIKKLILKFKYNGTIRSITIVYTKVCISSGL